MEAKFKINDNVYFLFDNKITTDKITGYEISFLKGKKYYSKGKYLSFNGKKHVVYHTKKMNFLNENVVFLTKGELIKHLEDSDIT